MNQLDLFGSAAAPTRGPARPDTAMLLAMSPDHALHGHNTAPQPNENGVYSPSEVLELPRPVKGWQGMPLAAIKLVDLGTHWLWACDYQIFSGDCRGGGCPLMDMDRGRAETRGRAIQAACDDLRAKVDGLDNADARAIAAWCATQAQAQLL